MERNEELIKKLENIFVFELDVNYGGGLLFVDNTFLSQYKYNKNYKYLGTLTEFVNSLTGLNQWGYYE